LHKRTIYQACSGTNKANNDNFLASLKQGNSELLAETAVYHDSSIFTATLRQERLKAKVKKLRNRELRVLRERRDLQRKQVVAQQIQNIDPDFAIDVNKLIVMPVTDLLRRKNTAIVMFV